MKFIVKSHLALAPLMFASLSECRILAEQAVAKGTSLPKLQTEGTQWVRITHPGLDASWRMEFPEDVETQDAFYLVWQPISVDWKEYRKGEIGYDWEASQEWIGTAKQKLDMRGFPIHPGLHVSVRLLPSPNRLDLSIRLTNRTGKTLKQLTSSGGCLQHQTERFIDKDSSRTFIRTAQGLTRLSDTDRAVKIRSFYLFEPRWYDTPVFTAWEYFWGRSKARPSSGFIASAAADGRGAVGIGFDHSYGLAQNSDNNHHCMHSGLQFGSLPPDQTIERQGVILFGETVQGLFQRFEGLGYRPDLNPPSN